MNPKEKLRLGKGTRNFWITSTGKEYNVKDLDTLHLANTIEYLRERAREHLSSDRITDYSTDYKTPTVGEIEGLLFEHCITYPALREEAKRRDIWDEEKIYIGPKQKFSKIKHQYLNIDKKVQLLIELVEELLDKK